MIRPLTNSCHRLTQRFRQHLFIVAVTSALVLASMLSVASLTYFLRGSAIKAAEEHTQNLAFVLAEQTTRVLRSVELVTNGIAHDLQISAREASLSSLASDPSLQNRLRDRIAGLSDLDNVAIVSENGRLLNRTRAGPIPKVDLSNRDYITQLRDAPPQATYLSNPTRSPTTGTWEVAWATRISGQSGRFLGVVIGVIELHNFEDLYSKVALGVHGSISMTRIDGIHLARFPHVDAQIGGSLLGTAFFQDLVLKNRDGVIQQVSPIDGVERLVAAQHVRSFPVVLAVSMSIADVLADWRRQALFLSLLGVLACLVMIIGAVLLARRIDALTKARFELGSYQERERAQEEMATQLERFDAALQNMSQGLAMFDEASNLIVCNGRYADLYRLPAHLTAAGTPRKLLTAHRKQVRTDKVHDLPRQNLPGQEEILINELRDGRIISVKHCPMRGGGFVSTHEDVTELRKAEDRIAYLAEHDPLTGLPNRAKFRAELDTLVRSQKQDFAIFYIDLDRFKPVNDTLGHSAGDALLREVAGRLIKGAGPESMTARLGGDEFAIIAPGTDRTLADGLAADLISSVSQPFEIREHVVSVGASIGIAIAMRDGNSADELTSNADLALYAAKAEGRGIHRFFEAEMSVKMRARRDLEADLRSALIRGEFELHYQPLVAVRDQALQSFEALLRWNSPRRGTVAPGDFIPIAEEIGLICDIGEWVLNEACRCAAKWPDHLRVAVNLSPAQFKHPDLVSLVGRALMLAGLPGYRLELEITESLLLQDADKTIEILHEFRSMGIRISMDDFGTGYSSLNYLRLFPFDKLKIDRAFVKDLGQRDDCAAIVRAATSLARSLNMIATAEGVETEDQLRLIGLEGCTEAQGYLFSRPIPEAEVMELLANVKVRAA